MRNYKPFISGEHIDLCIPDIEAIKLDNWADWFNDIKANQNTSHAVFPNFFDNQVEFLEDLKRKEKLVLLVCRKTDRKAVGVVSLQDIDLSLRQALFAIMIGEPENLKLPGLAALEAVALIVEHGFSEVGLQRIYGGQSFPGLQSWNKLLELIGFQVDGIHRSSFKRGNTFSDSLHISCLYNDYLRIIKNRKNFWPGSTKIKELLRRQPKESYAEKLEKISGELREQHFRFLFDNH